MPQEHAVSNLSVLTFALAMVCVAPACDGAEAPATEAKPAVAPAAEAKPAEAVKAPAPEAEAPEAAARRAEVSRAAPRDEACTRVFSENVEAVRMVSKAAATGSDIDMRFEFGTGRVSGSAYKMVDTILEATQPEYQAQPDQVAALKGLLKDQCLKQASSNGEAPKGFLRYGLVSADGSEIWIAAEGSDAGLPVDGAYYVAPLETFKAMNKAWPREPTG